MNAYSALDRSAGFARLEQLEGPGHPFIVGKRAACGHTSKIDRIVYSQSWNKYLASVAIPTPTFFPSESEKKKTCCAVEVAVPVVYCCVHEK
jgi:hypothetical protein